MKYSDFYGELICKGENTVRFLSLLKGDYVSMKTQFLRTICGALALIMLLFAVSCKSVDLSEEPSTDSEPSAEESNKTEKPTEEPSEEELLRQQLEELMALSEPMLDFNLNADRTFSVAAAKKNIKGIIKGIITNIKLAIYFCISFSSLSVRLEP